MTTPADDCGVKGGCHACPLFAANVCGDPAPEPEGVFEAHLDGLDCGRRPCEQCSPAPVLSIAIDGYDAVNDAELPGMWEAADFTGGLDEVRPLAPRQPARFEVDRRGMATDRAQAVPVCVQTETGEVPCGTDKFCRSREAKEAVRHFEQGAEVRPMLAESVRRMGFDEMPGQTTIYDALNVRQLDPAPKTTPEEWCIRLGYVVLDADGWEDKPWSEPITRAEFLRRAVQSTAAKVPTDDASDVDPNEPRSEGGCCGGGCCA